MCLYLPSPIPTPYPPPMLHAVLSRLGQSLLVLWVVSFAVYGLMKILET